MYLQQNYEGIIVTTMHCLQPGEDAVYQRPNQANAYVYGARGLAGYDVAFTRQRS